jgi:predicted kinase
VRRRVVVLRGPAGVGKSTLAAALRDTLGYPTAAIDTDLFNWAIVPGESNKQVVYDNLGLLAESYLRYDYDVVISGLILTAEERGALASLRAKAGLLGGSYTEVYCHATLDTTLQRHADRGRDVDPALIEDWWHLARADVSAVPWKVHELDMEQPLAVNVQNVLRLLQRTD